MPPVGRVPRPGVRHSSFEQIPQVVERERLGELILSEYILSQLALGLLQCTNFLFDAVFDEQPIGDDRLLLAYAVGPVDGLIFNGWIPPRVKENDVAGRRQVESESAGPEGDQEDCFTRVFLELLNEFAPVFGVAGQVVGRPVSLGDGLLNQTQHFDELGKDDDLTALLHDGIESLHEGFDLGALGLGVLFDQLWVAAYLP